MKTGFNEWYTYVYVYHDYTVLGGAEGDLDGINFRRPVSNFRRLIR
jgi:hypothetical protein